MAKSAKPAGIAAEIVPPHVIEKARALLTGAEKKFFNSSFGATLAKHSHAQVEAAVKQARILRNKWRDLYASQSRTAKRSGRATAAANVRTREKHDLLADAVARFEKRLAELKAAVSSSARPVAAKVAAAMPKKPAKATRKILSKADRRISKKASRRVTAGLAVAPAAQLVTFDRAKQRKATTAAKASRIKRSGQGTQRLGHTAASGRRAQRRRDIHSRG
ncbi:MAG: hypothetical protein WCR51_07520 [Planctomycetia bacterium]